MSRTTSCLGCTPCPPYVCVRKDRWRGRTTAKSQCRPRGHITTNTPDSTVNLRHISYSILFLLCLWIYVVSLCLVKLLYYCTAYSRRFLEAGDLHPKENPSKTSPQRKRKQKPSKHTKKAAEEGCNWKYCSTAADSYKLEEMLHSNSVWSRIHTLPHVTIQ